MEPLEYGAPIWAAGPFGRMKLGFMCQLVRESDVCVEWDVGSNFLPLWIIRAIKLH